jgi:DNA end-binding protein Ku
MAPKSTWKGGLGFGMVSIPIKLYTAVDEKSIDFHQMHRACGGRIKQSLTCPKCNVTVDRKDLVKGYEVGKDQYVYLEEAELASARLKSLKNIDVLEFVPAGEIDARMYESAYHVIPEEAGVKAFSLFLQAMAKVNMVGIAKLTFKTKEKLCAIRPFGKVILLQTLYYADEIKPTSEVEVKLADVSEREMTMAVSLVQSMASDKTNLSKYEDKYREALKEIIQSKLDGKPFTPEVVVEAPAPDLVDALMASINAANAKKTPAAVS